MIVVVCGLPGVGKTTLAEALAPSIDAVLLSTDKIRKELISEPTYSVEERELVYDVMLLVAKYLHGAGVSCILDGTFNTAKSRRSVMDKIAIKPTQFHLVECVCPDDVAINRLRSRKKVYSDADVSVYKRMKDVYEAVREDHMVADTSKGPPELLAREVRSQILKRNDPDAV